jgi:DNA-binding transcriptional LysR family regulator
MNLEGIDIFVKVIQAGSFTKAAQALKKPVTTVSDKVAQLEKRLGVTLIHRTTRQLKLTPVGESYYEKCLRALAEFEVAEQELQTSKREPQGRLRVTMSVDVGHSVMPDLAKRFLQKYSNVKLELMVTNRMVDLIGEGVDLGIRIGKLSDSTYRARKYMEATASIWATPEFIKKHGKPESPKQLEKIPAVSFTLQKNQTIELSRNKEKIKVHLQSRIQADDMETVKQLTLESIGVGFFPDFICEKEERSGQLIRLLPEWTWSKIPLWFVYPEQKFVSPNVKAFIDLALQEGLDS